MNCQELIEELKACASEKQKANAVRMGILQECSIGVSTGDVRRLARQAERSDELAFELWNTGYHEAKLLAALLFDYKKMSDETIERLMSDVVSWDLCDHLCKNLIIKMKNKDHYIDEWTTSAQIYKKRAAFTLIAASAVHDKKLSNDMLDHYMRLISEHSADEREHVKKAVSWALREIGKKDFNYNEKALLLAYDLAENGNKAQKWIARDVIKEIGNVVQVKGRGRLISADTKMGKEAVRE